MPDGEGFWGVLPRDTLSTQSQMLGSGFTRLPLTQTGIHSADSTAADALQRKVQTQTLHLHWLRETLICGKYEFTDSSRANSCVSPLLSYISGLVHEAGIEHVATTRFPNFTSSEGNIRNPIVGAMAPGA